MWTRLLIVALAALVVAGTRGGASKGAAGTATSTVGVWLKEWQVIPSAHVVPAGKVTFVVSNIGKLEHELVVVRTDRAPDGLAVKTAKAVETGSQGEVEELRSPLTDRLTLNLAPGRYVLLCNLGDHGGHYRHGMFATLTVR
jgi:uncharacterized cupredoxin-like copper-binding protein